MDALGSEPKAFNLLILATRPHGKPMTLMKLYLLNLYAIPSANQSLSYLHKVLVNFDLLRPYIDPHPLTPSICHLNLFNPPEHLLNYGLHHHHIVTYVDLQHPTNHWYALEYLNVLPDIRILSLHTTHPQVLQSTALTEFGTESGELSVTQDFQEVGVTQG